VPSYRIAPNALIALPFAALLLAGALLPRLDRIVRFGCAWALAASLPVLPIPFFSDRYHYIVFAGLAIAAGRIVSLLLRGETRRWMRTHEDMTAAGSKAPAVSPSPANAMPTTIVTAPAATMAPVPPAADAASHPARGRLALASLAIAAALAHVIWSVAGAREQAAYYAFKGVVPSRLLEEARAYEDAAAHPGRRARGPGPAILAIVWRGDAVHLGQVFQEAEARVLKPRFSDTHPFYVRPQGVLGAVYPLDLFNLAAEERGGFYRRPAPAGAARALAKGNVRVVPVGLFYWGKDAPAGLSAHVAGRLRDALLARREIPQSLPGEEGPSAPEWKVAWIEATDRAGAFETEYGPEPEPGPAPAASRVPVDPSPPQAGSTPGSRR
jgi:hypothetical protein